MNRIFPGCGVMLWTDLKWLLRVLALWKRARQVWHSYKGSVINSWIFLTCFWSVDEFRAVNSHPATCRFTKDKLIFRPFLFQGDSSIIIVGIETYLTGVPQSVGMNIQMLAQICLSFRTVSAVRLRTRERTRIAVTILDMWIKGVSTSKTPATSISINWTNGAGEN